MDPKSIQTLYGYNYWAFDRVWKCIEQLTEDRFNQPIEYSTGSIHHHIVHVMSATRRWLSRLQAAQTPPRLSFEEYVTLASARAKWDELRTETLDYTGSLTQEQLDETIHWELADRGTASENRRWEILLHVANHATDHRSQILVMLNTRFGIETPEQDLILYLREHADDHT